MNTDRINGIGALFRFITPALIIVLGTLMVFMLQDVKVNVVKLEDLFENHLEHHRRLEVSLEKRLSRIETCIESLMLK